MSTLSRNQVVAAAVILSILWALGCAGPGSRAAVVRPDTRRFLYARGDVQYRQAYFFKPADSVSDGLEARLAPLIVQQVSDGGVSENHCDWFGVAEVGDAGRWTVDPTRPTVYAGTSNASLKGGVYEQVIYVWLYTSAGSGRSERRFHAQGVRMTLDAKGFPIIWEVLGNDTGVAVIYVADSLEDAAADEFGPPLSERRFAVERAVSQQPSVVVGRVLADGPVPMGPFVYLEVGTRAVSTIICRCMPSQVDHFVESEYYDLRPLDSLGELVFRPDSPLSDLGPALGGQRGGDPSRLQKILRLPRDF